MIDIPTLAMRGDDDQIVPVDDSALLPVKLLKKVRHLAKGEIKWIESLITSAVERLSTPRSQ